MPPTLTHPARTVTPAPTPAQALMLQAFAALIDQRLAAEGRPHRNAAVLLDPAIHAGLAEITDDGQTLTLSILGVGTSVPHHDGLIVALRQWQTAAHQHITGRVPV